MSKAGVRGGASFVMVLLYVFRFARRFSQLIRYKGSSKAAQTYVNTKDHLISS